MGVISQEEIIFDQPSGGRILEPEDIVQKQPGTLSKAGEFLKGYYEYLHTPTDKPKSVKDFITRVIPESISKTTVGLVEFPYHAIKSVTDPFIEGVVEGVKGKKTSQEIQAEVAKKLGKNIYENVEGVARFAGEPIGVYGWDKLKERWLTDPVGSLLGVAPLVKGVVSYAKSNGISPKEAIKEIELDKTHSNFERLKQEQVKAIQNKMAGGQRPLGKLVRKEDIIFEKAKEAEKIKDYTDNVFTEENLRRTEDLARAQREFDKRVSPEEKTIDELHNEVFNKTATPEQISAFEERMVGKEPEQLALDRTREEALKQEMEAKGKIEGFYPTEERAKAAVGGTEGIRERVITEEIAPKASIVDEALQEPTTFYHATDTPVTEWKPGQKVNFAERPMTEDFGDHVYKFEPEIKRPAPDMVKDPSQMKNVEYQGPKAEVKSEILRGKNVDAVVSSSPDEPGKFRVTTVDKKGVPNGHQTFDTYDEALKEGKASVGISSKEELSAFTDLLGIKAGDDIVWKTPGGTEVSGTVSNVFKDNGDIFVVPDGGKSSFGISPEQVLDVKRRGEVIVSRGTTTTTTTEIPQTAKQPWKMTRSEFVSQEFENGKQRANEIINIARNRMPNIPEDKKAFLKNKDYLSLDERKELDSLGRSNISVRHKKTVEQALSEGKPVPPEVLADYTDLVKGEGTPRTVKDIFSDINTALGEKGAVGKQELTPDQVAARKRLIYDFEKIKENAKRVGKTVDDYLTSLGIDEKIISSLKGVVQQQQGKEEGVIVNKGDYIGDGQKVRSFGISAATSDVVAPEVKAEIVSEIKPGGRGAYTPITLKGAQAEAVNKIAKDTEKAVKYVTSSRNPGATHTAVGVELIKKFQEEGNHERAADVALTLSKRLTKAGQEIVAAKLIGNLSPEGVLISANRAIEKFNEQASRKFGKKILPNIVKELKLGPETSQRLHDLAKAIKEAKDETIKTELSIELQKVLNELIPSSFGRKVATLQTVAQLLNPKTIITRNPLGNELFYRVERLNKYPVTLIDWLDTKLTGADRTITFRTGGAGNHRYWEGWLTGWKSGWEGINPKGLQTQYELGQKTSFRNKPYETQLADGTWITKMPSRAEKVASFLERTTGALLKSFDYAAYNRAYWNTIGELATLRSLKESGKIDKKLVEQYVKQFDDNVGAIADSYGKYVTFQDNNIISLGLQNVKKGLNLGYDFGAGDMVLKYPKTPGALLSRGLEYSPAGVLKSIYEIAQPFYTEKPFNKREFTMSVGRAITGTLGLSAIGYLLFDNGIITGPANDDKDVASAQRTLGTHPYKVNISAFKRWIESGFNQEAIGRQKGDTFVSYDWAQPVSMSIAGGANMAKEYNERKTFAKAFKESLKGTPNVMYRGMESALETLIDQPVLSGLLKLSAGYGAKGMADSIVNIASEVPASFTPTLLNQIRIITDNTKRSTYDPDKFKVAANKAINRIPGLSGYLPEAYDTLGYQKEVYPQEGNNPFNVMVNPAFVSKFLPTKPDELTMKVYRDTGSTRQFPRESGKVIGIPVKRGKREDTIRIELTPTEYQKLQKITGTMTRKMFNRIPDDMPVEAQEILMVQLLTYAGIIGRKSIINSVKERLKDQFKSENITVLD